MKRENGTSDSVTVRLNKDQTFQTIDGFGGFGPRKVWWEQPPYHDSEFVNLLIADLGLTILRDSLPISFEPENENLDPYTLDLNKYNLTRKTPGSEAPLSFHLSYLKAMHQAGLKRLIVSIWSPPVWMKHNQAHGNGSKGGYSAPEYTLTPDNQTNQLRVDYYEEFAEYCVAYIRLLKEQIGIDLYAISLQNEPRFSQFYVSSVHSPESLAELIKVVGRRFEREGVTTKIFAPEDVSSIWHIRRYLKAILNDQEVSSYTPIFALHNYDSDGVSRSSGVIKNWQETYQLAKSGGKKVWMTETSGFDADTIEDGIVLAVSIYNALRYGNVSAWLYWQMSESKDGGLIENGQPNILYFVSKHFYKHIKPGALRVQAVSSEEQTKVVAFYHPVTEKTTLVMINSGRVSKRVEIDETYGVALWHGYVTDGKNYYRHVGKAAGKELTLPAYSIMTLLSVPL